MSARTVYVALQQFCETDDAPLRLLEEAGFEVRRNRLGRRLRGEEIPAAIGDSQAVLAGVEPYDAAVLGALPRLRCISRCGIGTDTIDLEAARRRNVAVLTTPDEVVEPVAQMTVAMILALARNFPLHLSDFRMGKWVKRTGHLLSEWTIGLVGFGRIGQAVGRCLQPFHPRLLICDPQAHPEQIPAGALLCGLAELLPQSDLVSLHADGRPGGTPLIGRPEIAEMKGGSRLVNTARGYLVDEQALYDALQAGLLSGAALDVFEPEPYHGPLAKLPQVLLTPHVSSLTHASRKAMEARCAQNVVDFFRTNGS